MKYFLFLIPLALLLLSKYYGDKYQKLKGSGRLVELMRYDRLTVTCFAFAIVCFLAIIFFLTQF